MTRQRPLLAAIATLAWLLGVTDPATGHLAQSQQTLLSLVGGSDLVARVSVVDPDAVITVKATGERRPVVKVVLREVIKGEGEAGTELLFASHGHGVADYRAAEDALVFLSPLARVKELAALEKSGLRWVSLQEHDGRFVLSGESAAGVLAATRAYAAVGRLAAEPELRIAALRKITLQLLTSDDARLAASAVRDLVGARSLPLVTAADVPALLTEVVNERTAPIAVRIGLLAELEHRELLRAAAAWESMLHSTPQPDLLKVVRAAGRHPSPKVNATLNQMLRGDSPLAEAAAQALGNPSHADSVPALANTLERDEPRVRMAAIRALGRIGTPAARNALEIAATSHSDPATRRRAAAEVRSQSRIR